MNVGHGWRRCWVVAAAFGLAAGCRTAPSPVPLPSLTHSSAAVPSSAIPPDPIPPAAQPIIVSALPPEGAAEGASHAAADFRIGADRMTRLAPLAPSDSSVTLVAFQQDAAVPQELPAPAVGPEEPPPVMSWPAEPLELETVLRSVHQSYPLLRNALLERQVADGKQLAALGEFDLKVKAYGIAQPLGFYQNYRHGISVEQPLFPGGYLYGGYKIGDGDFPPWFGERETNEGGEFSAGLGLALLKDRQIDKRRAALFQADLARQKVEPAMQAQLLDFVQIASQVYWSWVAAGQMLEAQRELLRNARARVQQIEERVNAGDLKRITRINNEQLIAARETKRIESERKLQQAAYKLSLFLRDGAGEPILPDESQLPAQFPPHQVPDEEVLQRDLANAVAASPVLAELNLQAEQVRVELRSAENLLLPELNAQILGSKDVGAPASPKGDKTPFELEAGFYGELPFQRREGRGKVLAAQAKLAQIDVKRQFTIDKISVAFQDAFSALTAAAARIEQAKSNLQLARETLELAKVQFEAGDVDLFELNLYEQGVTDAQLLLIAAEADFFLAVADYRAALAAGTAGNEGWRE